DQQDVGLRSDGGDHVEVQGYLPVPAAVRWRVLSAAALVDLAEAAAGAGAGRQAVLPAIGGQVGLGGRVVEGIDDGDGLPRPSVGRQRIRTAQIGRTVAGRRGRDGGECAGGLLDVGPAKRETGERTGFRYAADGLERRSAV